MLTRTLGNSGIQASAIALGTWAIGGAMWGGSDDEKSLAAIRSSIESGINLIDTAPGYGLGHAEELIGQAISGHRQDVVIATKCGLNWHSGKGEYFFDQYGKAVQRYLGADGIIHELEESLRRLSTDYIDIYITHWPDPTTPIDETIAALTKLKEQGKIRAIGASNLSEKDLASYIKAGALDCIQEQFSMIDPGLKDTLLPMTKSQRISTLSYSPLAMGLLSGKVHLERKFEGDDIRAEDPRFSESNRRSVLGFVADLRPVLTQYDATASQIVIAWTLQQPQIDFVLCGARTQPHALENAKAGGIELSSEALAAIDAAIEANLTGLIAGSGV